MSAPTLQPWEQQPGESSEAYAAFRAYRDLGPDRSILKAYAQLRPKAGSRKAPAPANAPGSWKRWAQQWRWKERVEAYDRRMESVEQGAREEARKAHGVAWEARFEEFRERAYGQLLSLQNQVGILCGAPICKVETNKVVPGDLVSDEDGKKKLGPPKSVTTILNPALDGLRAIKAQTELAQLCFGGIQLSATGPNGGPTSEETGTNDLTEGEVLLVPDTDDPQTEPDGESASS